MAKFRKKPVVIEAVQLPEVNDDVSDDALRFVEEANAAIPGMILPAGPICNHPVDGGVIIRTLEGDMRGDPGDWLIRGVKGEIYPCKPDIFAATYEPVPDDG